MRAYVITHCRNTSTPGWNGRPVFTLKTIRTCQNVWIDGSCYTSLPCSQTVRSFFLFCNSELLFVVTFQFGIIVCSYVSIRNSRTVQFQFGFCEHATQQIRWRTKAILAYPFSVVKTVRLCKDCICGNNEWFRCYSINSEWSSFWNLEHAYICWSET